MILLCILFRQFLVEVTGSFYPDGWVRYVLTGYFFPGNRVLFFYFGVGIVVVGVRVVTSQGCLGSRGLVALEHALVKLVIDSKTNYSGCIGEGFTKVLPPFPALFWGERVIIFIGKVLKPIFRPIGKEDVLSLKIVPISGDHYRSDILRRVCHGGSIPVDEDAQAIIDLVQGRLADLSDEFQQALVLKTQAYTRKRMCLHRRKGLLVALDREIRGFWSGLKWLMRRHKLPASFAQMFRDNAEHHRPVARSTAKKISVAQNIIAGEIRSQKLGYPPMANPNLAEITKALKAVTEAGKQVDRETRIYQGIRSQYGEIRDKIDKNLLDLVGYIRVAFRGQDQTERRNLLRSLGFLFVSDEGQDKLKVSERGERTTTETVVEAAFEVEGKQPLPEGQRDEADGTLPEVAAVARASPDSPALETAQHQGLPDSNGLSGCGFTGSDPPSGKRAQAVA